MGDETDKGTPADADGAEPRIIEQGLKEIVLMLGESAAEILPTGTTPIGLSREDFQSRTFIAAELAQMPKRYGISDRALYTLTYEDGTQVFVAGGRVSQVDSHEVIPDSVLGVLDLRGQYAVAYVYDGDETMTEYMPGQEHSVYEGELGRPESLLFYARQSLGVSVGVTEYIPAPS